MTDPEIPGWEFAAQERSRLVSALFPRQEPDPTFDFAYPEKNHALRQMIRRLNDYDANTFTSEPRPTDTRRLSSHFRYPGSA